MKKRSPGELLVELRIVRNRLERDLAKLDRRINALHSMAVQSFPTVPALSQRVMKEVDQLERVRANLMKLSVLLEMLELRLETVLTLNAMFGELRPVVKAVRELSKSFPVPLEVAPDIEGILSDLAALAVPQHHEPVVQNDDSEVKRILEEAEKIASIKSAKAYIVEG